MGIKYYAYKTQKVVDFTDRIDRSRSQDFLLSNDYLCYAYGPYDSNEFKYSRIKVPLYQTLLIIKA